MKIDSHQHFWKFDPIRDSWIDETMAVIKRDFLPADLQPILETHGIDSCVAVQADQSETENEFLLSLAAENDFIKGIVGWVDLRAGDIAERLDHYSQYPKLKGFRHVLQGEADRTLMLTTDFMNGVRALQKHNFKYDILIFPDQLIHTFDFVKQFPDQAFVIDHIAKPNIKNKEIKAWAKDMSALARFENLYCKISGMVTEADWKNWGKADFKPYLDVIFETFGTKRLMFGSDWPVCNVAGGYDNMIDIVKEYTAELSETEQAGIWGNNAAEFYNL